MNGLGVNRGIGGIRLQSARCMYLWHLASSMSLFSKQNHNKVGYRYLMLMNRTDSEFKKEEKHGCVLGTRRAFTICLFLKDTHEEETNEGLERGVEYV